MTGRRQPSEPFLHAFESDPFEYQVGSVCLRRDVFRRSGLGPPIILIHEIPVVNESTVRLADRIHGLGFTMVLPSLVGRPKAASGLGDVVGGMVRLCIASEFGALTRNRTAPITDWLRALARRESSLAGGSKVGVIGMCFSGGFALATVLEPSVGAAVMSQPALPFLFQSDIGLSRDDLRKVKDRVGGGSCLRVLRYSADFKSPDARFQRYLCEFPDIEPVEIPTNDRNMHSVLRNGLSAPPDSDVGRALDGTLTFLRRELDWPASQDASGD